MTIRLYNKPHGLSVGCPLTFLLWLLNILLISIWSFETLSCRTPHKINFHWGKAFLNYFNRNLLSYHPTKFLEGTILADSWLQAHWSISCDSRWCIIQRKPCGHGIPPDSDTGSAHYLHFLKCKLCWSESLPVRIFIAVICSHIGCSSAHKSTAINTLMKTLSLNSSKGREALVCASHYL